MVCVRMHDVLSGICHPRTSSLGRPVPMSLSRNMVFTGPATCCAFQSCRAYRQTVRELHRQRSRTCTGEETRRTFPALGSQLAARRSRQPISEVSSRRISGLRRPSNVASQCRCDAGVSSRLAPRPIRARGRALLEEKQPSICRCRNLASNRTLSLSDVRDESRNCLGTETHVHCILCTE